LCSFLQQIEGFEEQEESQRAVQKRARRERGDVRAMIEAHRKVSQTPAVPKTSKRKTTGGDTACSLRQ
jgi:hypothetical protein